MKIVFRPDYTSFDVTRLHFAIEKILSTTYMRGAKSEDAPLITDCITAVRWLLTASSDFIFPVGYIGDLPKVLLEYGARIMPISQANIGDIIFFEKMSMTHKKYMISHVGLMISDREFYHSSLHYGGGKISSLDDIDYNNLVLDESFLEIAKDPRNNE